jgi:hypothetical protein
MCSSFQHAVWVACLEVCWHGSTAHKYLWQGIAFVLFIVDRTVLVLHAGRHVYSNEKNTLFDLHNEVTMHGRPRSHTDVLHSYRATYAGPFVWFCFLMTSCTYRAAFSMFILPMVVFRKCIWWLCEACNVQIVFHAQCVTTVHADGRC